MTTETPSDIQDIETKLSIVVCGARMERGTADVTKEYDDLVSAISRVVQERDRYEKALTAIMHARRNPGVALTDMSRAGMREIAGAALAEVGQMEGK